MEICIDFFSFRQEQIAIKSIKDASKKGDTASAKILAREVVHSRKAVSKIYTAKANLSSVEMQMKGKAKMDMNFATNRFSFVLFCLYGRLPEGRKWVSLKGFCLTSGNRTNIPTSLGRVNPNTVAAGNRTWHLA